MGMTLNNCTLSEEVDMNTITLTQAAYGPTRLSGNSTANAGDVAWSAVATAISGAQDGDWIDESIYDLDDMTLDTLDQELANCGLVRGMMEHDGCWIVDYDAV